jgi:L-lactate dehydrogenase complex protein LldG
VRARVAVIVGGRSVFSWDPEWLPYDVASVMPDAIHGDSPRAAQAAAEIGVTGCDGALADTGSLVLLSGTGRPRAASLLPPTHLAIVRRDDLRVDAEEYFRARKDAIASAANCTFVTGPSRTADIELTLTVGVHGPGRVIVIVGPSA